MYQRSRTPGQQGQQAAAAPQTGQQEQDLQGNAAVQAQMNAEGQGESEESTHHLEYAVEGTGASRRDPEQTDGVLPFTDGGWDATAILENLTQIDDDELTLNDGNRCAAVSALAVHVRGGPGSVTRLCADVFGRMVGQFAASPTTDMSEQIRTHFARMIAILPAILGRLNRQTATFQDLRRISDSMKLLVDWDPNSPMNVEEYHSLGEVGVGLSSYVGQSFNGFTELEVVSHLLTTLPGYGLVLAVGTNDARTDRTNHAVNLQADDAGRVYLFDPWPREGDQLMFLDSDRQDVMDYFVNSEGEDRLWRIRLLMTPS